MEKKIAVVGTGANGSCLAADLVRANYQVALFDQWPEHVEAMRKSGLKVSMPSEELWLIQMPIICVSYVRLTRYLIMFL